LKEDAPKNINPNIFKSYLKDKLANYKIPKKFIVLDELPKNATGKVLKRVLREKVNNGDFGEI